MKIIKNILKIVIFAIVVLLVQAYTPVLAPSISIATTTTATVSKVTYEFEIEGTAIRNIRIISKTETTNKITFPDTITIGGIKYDVESIGENALNTYKNVITQVTIGNNVTYIGAKAFKDASNLTTVIFKDNKWLRPLYYRRLCV